MITFEELSALPRRKRREGIVEYLSQKLTESRDLNVPRQAVLSILDLGSRWQNDIFELARSEQTPEKVRQLLIEYVKATTGRNFDITAKGDGLQRQEVGPLVRALQRCRVPRQRCYLTVNFQVPHVTVTSLALIAAWAEKNANTIEFAYPKRRAQRIEGFLGRIGLVEAIGNKDAPAFHFDAKGHFAFLRLTPGLADLEQYIARINESFGRLLSAAPEINDGLVEISRILAENTLTHAQIDSPAWLFISHHPKPAGVDIALCDLGVGLRESIKTSDNEELAKSAQHECDWLAKVVDAGEATGTLRRVRELCRLHAGKMLIISGGASYQATVRRTAKGEMKAEENTVADRFHWDGTLVGVHLTQEAPEQSDQSEGRHDISDKSQSAGNVTETRDAPGEEGHDAAADSQAPVSVPNAPEEEAATASTPPADDLEIDKAETVSPEPSAPNASKESEKPSTD